MARPLRIDVVDGWYHVTARGIERRAIFDDRRDHEHLWDLLKAAVERFRAKAPDWLRSGEILKRASRRIGQRVSTYREDVRQRLTKGVDPDMKERLADGFALGTEAFREKVRHLAKGGREITQTRELRRRVAFTDLLATAVAMTIKRFEQKASSDANPRRHMEQIKAQCEM